MKERRIRMSALNDARRTRTTLLLRRFGTVSGVVAHRTARVGWHTVRTRLWHKGADEAGSFPVQLRLTLEELGPTFVKLGQLLSTRSDITSPAVQQELSKLQDHAPSIPTAKLAAELERSLGSQSTGLFAKFEMRQWRVHQLVRCTERLCTTAILSQ